MAKKVILDYNIGDTSKEEEVLARIDIHLVKAYWTTEEAMVKFYDDPEVVGFLVGPIAQINKRIINMARNLKVISRLGVGFNNIDVTAATARCIPVTLVLDYCVTEVADHAMAFILNFARKLVPLNKVVKKGNWSNTKPDIPNARARMSRMSNQTLGIMGTGRIGSALLTRAKTFGLKIIAHDPFLTPDQVERLGVEMVDFENLLIRSDFISLHAPLTRETTHVFDLEAFRKMKPTAYLINAARGGLVDEDALYQALKSGYIAGAGLDVTDPEPISPDSPLLKLDNILITGHSSWYSEEAVMELRSKAVKAIVDVVEGRWPQNIVNPEIRIK